MNKFLLLFNGFFIVFINLFNNMLSSSTSIFWTVFIHHSFSLILMYFLYMVFDKNKFRIGRLHLKYYIPGLLSSMIIMIGALSISKIGATFLITFNLIGQVLISGLIDEFGLFGMEKLPFRKKKLIGYSIIVSGIIIMFL